MRGGGALRCGCLLLLAVALIVVVSVLALVWLATRSIGPTFSNGAYTVKLGNGQTRVDRISDDAAQRFAAKIVPPTSPLGVLKLQVEGVDFSEEEINSQLAKELAANPVAASGLTVDRIFLELHPATTRAYVYAHFHGQSLVLSSHVTFSVADGVGQVTLSDAQLGDLPLGALWPVLLDWSGNRQAVEQRLAVTLPEQVSSVSPREGTLHVTIQLQRTFTRATTASAFSPTARLTAPAGGLHDSVAARPSPPSGVIADRRERPVRALSCCHAHA